ncbi:hypothetical protein, partial [Vibrio azureus]
ELIVSTLLKKEIINIIDHKQALSESIIILLSSNHNIKNINKDLKYFMSRQVGVIERTTSILIDDR